MALHLCNLYNNVGNEVSVRLGLGDGTGGGVDLRTPVQ